MIKKTAARSYSAKWTTRKYKKFKIDDLWIINCNKRRIFESDRRGMAIKKKLLLDFDYTNH